MNGILLTRGLNALGFAGVRMNSAQKPGRFATRGWIGGIVSAALVSGALLFAAPRAQGDDDRAKCQHRIEKAEVRLDRAIREHGENSADARSRRHELNEEREHCWSAYRGWWNGTERRWHTDRDWDHDHDDHDRDDHH
jgi:hypothetical protein